MASWAESRKTDAKSVIPGAGKYDYWKANNFAAPDKKAKSVWYFVMRDNF
jgi:hypothetical protein